jgi:hypothetical protein
MPVAHGNEAFGDNPRPLAAPVQAPRPAAWFPPATAICRQAMRSWRSPAPPSARDPAGEQRANEERHPKDRRIAEQLSRNGRIASGRSGPPRLNRRSRRVRAALSGTHQLHQPRHMLDRRLRHDAMPQVEHERPTTHRRQDRVYLGLQRVPPATSASGSRLPCSATDRGTSAPAMTRSVDVSTPTASTQVAPTNSPSINPARRGNAMIGTPGHRARKARTITPAGSITCARNCVGDRMPAQVSNNMSTSAPAQPAKRDIRRSRRSQ